MDDYIGPSGLSLAAPRSNSLLPTECPWPIRIFRGSLPILYFVTEISVFLIYEIPTIAQGNTKVVLLLLVRNLQDSWIIWKGYDNLLHLMCSWLLEIENKHWGKVFEASNPSAYSANVVRKYFSG